MKRQGASIGLCIVSVEFENANHIFFGCVLEKFMWSCVRQLLAYEWNTGDGEFITLDEGLSGRTQHIEWIFFLRLCAGHFG